MSDSILESSHFSAIFSEIKEFVDYVSIAVDYIEGNDVSFIAYRGPLPQDQALTVNFDISDAAILMFINEYGIPLILSDVLGDTPIARKHQKNIALLRKDPFAYNRSWIGVPLRINKQAFFVLEVTHDQRKYYTEKHLSLLQKYVDSESVRIRNTAFATILSRRANEYNAINTIQHAIFSRLEYSELIDLVVEQVQLMTSALQVTICSNEEQSFKVFATSKNSQEVINAGKTVKVYSELIRKSWLSGKTLRVVDTRVDPRVDTQVSQHLGIRSILIAPLMAAERPIGAILAINKELGSFGPFDERIISTLAQETSIGLENTFLFQEEQQRRMVAETMQTILTQLSFNQSLHDTLNTILYLGAKLFHHDAAVLYLLDAEHNQMALEIAQHVDENLTQKLSSPVAGQVNDLTKGGSFYPNTISVLVPEHSSSFPGGFLSALRIPIFANNHTDGFLDLFWKNEKNPSQEQLHLASMISRYISLAIERDRLLKKTADLARLQEQQRIAQALHDTVAQLMFRVGMEAQWCEKNLKLNEEEEYRIKTILRLVERSNEELRSAIFALNDHHLGGQHSLIDMIRDLLNEFQNETGIITSLYTTPDIEPLAAPMAEAVFRIVREALNNTRKHACASAILVSLHNDTCHLRLTIQDNGSGFPKEYSEKTHPPELHFGLATMHRLVSQLGGKLIFGNNDDHGVMIIADLPLCEG